jgi:hypothetical protein
MNQEGNSELEKRSVELSINEVQSNDQTQPVTIDVEAPSNDLADRMASAFDRNLDKLIEDVQAPPPPVKISKPKKVKGVKVKKVRTVKIKQHAYKPKQGKDSSFNAFVGSKIGSAFSLAATARRNAKLAGEEAKPKGYFLKQALGFEFGGDLINRTRGTFSNDPTAEDDPSLSKGERFAARLQRTEAPMGVNKSASTVPYTQPSLFDTNQYTQVVDNSLGEHIQKAVKKLQRCFEKVDKSLSNISADKNKEKQTVSEENTTIEILSEKFLKVKDTIKENNVLRRTFNTLKSKEIEAYKKAEEKRKEAIQESQLENEKNTAGTVGYNDPYINKPKGKGMLERAWDFIAGNDDEEDDGGDDSGGPSIDLPDREKPPKPRVKPRRPGSRLRLARRQFNRMRRGVEGGIKRAGEFAAEKGGKIGGFLQRKGGDLLNFGKKYGTKAVEASKGLWDNIGENIAKRVAFAGARNAGKYAPGILSTGFYAADTADRLNKKDYFGAWLNGIGYGADVFATGSAAASAGPQAPATGAAAGTAELVSGIADSINFVRDIFGYSEPKKKMSEGGMVKLAKGGMVPAMVGEAGPELITPASPFASMPMMMGSPAASSIATILGATSSVMNSAGPGAAAIKPFIDQTISPLAKIYGKPDLNIQTKVGNNLGNVKEPDRKGGILGLLKKLVGFITGKDEGDDGEDGGGDNGSNDNNYNGGGGDWAPLLALIRKGEGGYESIAGKDPIKGLTDWTIQKVASSAPSFAGAYQLDPRSVISWAKDVGLKPEDKFSPANQDKIAVGLIENRAQGKKWRSKQISDEQFGNNLASIWAALPVLSPTNGKQRGVSYYAGVGSNKANIKPEEVEGAFKQIGSGSSNVASNPSTTPTNPGNPSPTTKDSNPSKTKQRSANATRSTTTPSPSSNTKPVTPSPSVANDGGGILSILNLGGKSSSASGGGGGFADTFKPLIEAPAAAYTAIQHLRLAQN